MSRSVMYLEKRENGHVYYDETKFFIQIKVKKEKKSPFFCFDNLTSDEKNFSFACIKVNTRDKFYISIIWFFNFILNVVKNKTDSSKSIKELGIEKFKIISYNKKYISTELSIKNLKTK